MSVVDDRQLVNGDRDMSSKVQVPATAVRHRVVLAAIRIVMRSNILALSYRSIGAEAGCSHETARKIGLDAIYRDLVSEAFAPLTVFLQTPGSLASRRAVDLYKDVLVALRRKSWTAKLVTQVSVFAGGSAVGLTDHGYTETWRAIANLAVSALRRDRVYHDDAEAIMFADGLISFYISAATQMMCEPDVDDIHLLSSLVVDAR